MSFSGHGQESRASDGPALTLYCSSFQRICRIHACSRTISSVADRNTNKPFGKGSAKELVHARSLTRRKGASQYMPHRSIIALRQYECTNPIRP